MDIILLIIWLVFNCSSLQEEKAACESYHLVEPNIVDTNKNSKQKEYEGTVKRWKEEANAMEAKCKVKFIFC